MTESEDDSNYYTTTTTNDYGGDIYNSSTMSAASMYTTMEPPSSSPPSLSSSDSYLRIVTYNELPQMSIDWVWVWLVNMLSGYVGYFFMRSAAKILMQVYF